MFQVPSNAHLSWFTEELERRFIALVYVKKALFLRQTALATDIGIQLELLTSKLHLYMKDDVVLGSVQEDINSVKQKSLDHQFNIHFYALEYLPSTAPYDISMLEVVQESYSEARPSFDRYEESRAAAPTFYEGTPALYWRSAG